MTKPPQSGEAAEMMCGLSLRAAERELEVAVYLIGDGVLCAKAGQRGYRGEHLEKALETGVEVKASKQDLSARAITDGQVQPGIEIVDDLAGAFVEDAMERADRVVSW